MIAHARVVTRPTAAAACRWPTGGPRPIDFRSADWQRSRSDMELTAAIRDGRGAMPPFNDVLSGGEIAALAAYVRQLGTSTDTP